MGAGQSPAVLSCKLVVFASGRRRSLCSLDFPARAAQSRAAMLGLASPAPAPHPGAGPRIRVSAASLTDRSTPVIDSESPPEHPGRVYG